MARKKTIQDCQHLASLRNGKCLSLTYKDNHSDLEWECENGHRWKETYQIIKRGNWCEICFTKSQITLNDIKVVIFSKNGKILSTSYKNKKHYFLIKCENGHE